MLVRSGAIDPAAIMTRVEPVKDAIDAYRAFDHRESGWTKVVLESVSG